MKNSIQNCSFKNATQVTTCLSWGIIWEEVFLNTLIHEPFLTPAHIFLSVAVTPHLGSHLP